MKHGKCRIAYLDTSKVFSGAEFSLLELVHNLDQDRYDPSLVLDFPQSHQGIYDRLSVRKMYRAPRCEWWMGSDRWARPIRGSDLLKRLILGQRLHHILKRECSTIMHLNLTWNRSFWDLWFARRAGAKVVAHVRSLLPGFRLSPLLLGQADAVICVSNIVKSNVMSWCSHSNVKRVYDPIDCDRYANAPVRENAKAHLGVAANRRLICSIALLSPHKGHDTAIAAFARVAKKLWDVDLFIVGGNPDSSVNGVELTRLKTLASQFGLLDRVHFTERQIPNVEVAFGAADLVLALTDCGEAFGRVPLEAGAAARPVIATNLGATPEIVIDGKTGVLVPPRDSERVANSIERILSCGEFALSLGETARAYVMSNFSCRTHVAEVERVYNELH